MSQIYLATLIFGAIFIVPMMLGGLDFDGDVEFDFDGELEGDLDFDPDIDADFDADPGSALGDFLGSLVSFRSVVFFAGFFGLSGVVFGRWFDQTAALTLVLAITLGTLAVLANGWLMSALKRSMSDSSVTARDISGARATVILPIEDGRKGRVRAMVAGQMTYMVALPHRTTNRFDAGDAVVVVEVQDGTALVAPLPGLGPGENE